MALSFLALMVTSVSKFEIRAQESSTFKELCRHEQISTLAVATVS